MPSERIPVSGRVVKTRVAQSGRTVVPLRRFLVDILRGIANFSSSNRYATANPGGEAGQTAAAGGFGIIVLAYPLRFRVTTAELTSRTSGATAGWEFRFDGGGNYQFFCSNGASAPGVSNMQATASDTLKAHVFVAVLDSGGLLRTYWDGYDSGLSTSLGGTFAAHSGAQEYGARTGIAASAIEIYVLGIATYRGTASAAQIKAYADAARELDDLPTSIGGATMTHHWSVRRTLSAGTDQSAPALMADNITGATADRQSKVGQPLTAAVLTSIEGRMTYGTLGWSPTDLYQSAAGVGIVGVATGFWVALYGRIDQLSTGTASLFTNIQVAANQGWGIQTDSNYSSVYFIVSNGVGTFVLSSGYAAAATDTNMPKLFVGVFTGSALRNYVNGVQVGADVAITGYTPGAGKRTVFGARDGGTAPASNFTIFGGAGGNGVPTLAQVQQLFADVAATGRIQRIPGMTNSLWDVTQDVIDAGVAVPATLLDRVGTSNMTRSGTLRLGQRKEHIWGFETAPIAYGIDAFTDADYYATAAGTAGVGTGFWVSVLLIINSTGAGPNPKAIVAKQNATGTQGYVIKTETNNTIIQAQLASGVGAATTGTVIGITSVDLGRLQLFTFVCTGTAIQQYWKRVLVSSNAMVGFTASADPFRMGRHSVNAGANAAGITVLGIASGNGIPTLGQIQAHYDACMVAEDITTIAGLTDHLWSVTDSQAGSAPATIADQVGADTLAIAGAPTLVPKYQRMWGW